jgi:hypothetical protein
MRSVFQDSLHYIRNGDGSEELYDLGADPWERNNLTGSLEMVDVLVELRSSLDEIPDLTTN